MLVPTSGLMDRLDPTMLPPRKRAKAEYVMPRAKESLSKAIAAGVKVAVGTDAPILPHGKNAFEVVVMVERGMTPAQALRSATIVPAELIRMDDIGQIQEGMHADLIAVAANPLDDIGTLENVSFVMKAGRVYKLVD